MRVGRAARSSRIRVGIRDPDWRLHDRNRGDRAPALAVCMARIFPRLRGTGALFGLPDEGIP